MEFLEIFEILSGSGGFAWGGRRASIESTMARPASAESLHAAPSERDRREEGARDLARDLLRWYDRQARRLPWRLPPNVAGGNGAAPRPDPYRVWLSEVMLQQTTVAAVAPYYQAFLARWPTVDALAAAPLEDVLSAWAGLGYYARARNLHKCARTVSGELGGRFPESEAALRRLPGVGPYTAAAVAAIAFDQPATPVDGNVERVTARLFAVESPLPKAKADLRRLAEGLTPNERPGDFAQAMMDLGATVCLARRPRCLACPLTDRCAARAAGLAEALPRRAAKAPRPTRRGVAFWTVDAAGAVLLRRRPPEGLLGGMMELPSTPWREAAWPADEARAAGLAGAPAVEDWTVLPGLVRHTFTHFHLELAVWAGRAAAVAPPAADAAARWVPLDGLADEALPSVMRKVVRHALERLAAG
jgi:A/G-specific adenine glycosylase